MKLWEFLFGKKAPPNPSRCNHDWDMTFPNEKSLDWVFVCTKCGEKRSDMPGLM